MAKLVFVDTWAWAALADKRDQWHVPAAAARLRLREERARFVTTNVVVYEAHGLLRGRCPHSVATGFVDHIRTMAASPDVLEVVWAEPDLDDAALDILRRYADKDFSFVDCLSFAAMQQRGITTAFTGDEHFRHMGFETIPLL